MSAKELRKMSTDELQNELLATRREQFNLRMQKGVGQTPSPHLFNKAKKQIARIKTILSENEGSSS
jgi:large subunit ribosomal protein L29